MPSHRYRVTVPVFFRGPLPGQEILLPIGTTVVLVTTTKNRARWGIAEASTGTIAKTFPSEAKRQLWVLKHTEPLDQDRVPKSTSLHLPDNRSDPSRS